MSEYQYYEFRALDRSLTAEDMKALRRLSSRADITPSSFTNVYNFGNFRGDPNDLMEKYFDAFVYVASGGTHEFMLRIPQDSFSQKQLYPFLSEDGLQARRSGDDLILRFFAEPEPDWYDEDGERWMDELVPLRADLIRGDCRALYLGFLAAARLWEPPGDDEHAVPAGLKDLSPALQRLAAFLGVDEDLLAAVAEASPDLPKLRQKSTGELRQWIANQPESDKNDALFGALSGEDPRALSRLLSRFERESAPPRASAEPSLRSVAQLLNRADELETVRRRAKEEARRKAAEEEARRQAEERAAYLKELAPRQPECWREVEALIAMKRPRDYDRAVTLLADLRDLSTDAPNFRSRVQDLRRQHAAKSSFLARLAAAGL